MAIKRKSASALSAARVSHFARVQESVWCISTAVSEKDLVARFQRSADGLFPDGAVRLQRYERGSSKWSLLSPGDQTMAPVELPLPDEGEAIRAVSEPGRRREGVVHRLPDGSMAGVVLEMNRASRRISDVHSLALKALVQAYVMAYQTLSSRRTEKSLIFALNHRVLQLNSLIDTGIEVATLNQSIRPEQLALERAASLTNASRGTVTIAEKEGVRAKHSFPDGTGNHRKSDPAHRIRSSFKIFGRTYTFDLFEKESRTGIQPFDDTDQLLLDALAKQVYASLENRHLHAMALEKQKIERDIAVAASIQQRILPRSLPVIPGYDIAGINIPSKSVGGDYYDCVPLADGRFAFVIADVAGKGVPAALLVSSFHAFLAAYLEASMPLLELGSRLNRMIRHAATDDKYITAFFGILSPASGQFHTLNAGHNPVYVLRRNNDVLELVSGGVPLGMLDMDLPFQSQETFLERGDRLLLYTDGITEAANERDEFFDTHVPLKQWLVERHPGKADVLIKDLITEIRSFTGTAPQNDDITAMYLIRN